MTDQIPESVKSKEDEVLDYTQGKRRALVESLTKGGQPEERGDKMVLLSALDGMDKQTLTKMRIKTDDKNSNAVTQATSLIASLLTKINPKQLQSNDLTREAPVLVSDVPASMFVDGETAVGTQNGTYEDFINKFPNDVNNI